MWLFLLLCLILGRKVNILANKGNKNDKESLNGNDFIFNEARANRVDC